jgi:hypothetical protein
LLRSVDLGAFAAELARRGVHKSKVLDGIRAEFRNPFGELRKRYEFPPAEKVFFMLLGDREVRSFVRLLCFVCRVVLLIDFV